MYDPLLSYVSQSVIHCFLICPQNMLLSNVSVKCDALLSYVSQKYDPLLSYVSVKCDPLLSYVSQKYDLLLSYVSHVVNKKEQYSKRRCPRLYLNVQTVRVLLAADLIYIKPRKLLHNKTCKVL